MRGKGEKKVKLLVDNNPEIAETSGPAESTSALYQKRIPDNKPVSRPHSYLAL
jgi:hypothetical protein